MTASDPKRTVTYVMTNNLKTILGDVAFLSGLYIVTLYSGTTWFYVGLLAVIWGGWTLGEWLRYRNRE